MEGEKQKKASYSGLWCSFFLFIFCFNFCCNLLVQTGLFFHNKPYLSSFKYYLLKIWREKNKKKHPTLPSGVHFFITTFMFYCETSPSLCSPADSILYRVQTCNFHNFPTCSGIDVRACYQDVGMKNRCLCVDKMRTRGQEQVISFSCLHEA